jgi:hypothetical protein
MGPKIELLISLLLIKRLAMGGIPLDPPINIREVSRTLYKILKKEK